VVRADAELVRQSTLPEIITELTSRGQVFRTDVNDTACAANTTKIGPDADGKPGGCDDVRILLSGTNPPQVAQFHAADP
jgi:hypothetical protein